ncbi:hypothetical protein HGRIS_007782 [Hohenbuehelia grisea]|uniref:Uncharacterized protein n=1 Tax=Hohenbuehelia grisea TaxID=104357 RepID=A0ABR3J622_9AGAR
MNPQASSRTNGPSPPSTASLNKSASVRSTATRAQLPPVTTVITAPPWARDEPPSPKEPTSFKHEPREATESRPSDVASFTSSQPGSFDPASRWWTFTLPRPREMTSQDVIPPGSKLSRKGIMDRSKSWLPTSGILDVGSSSKKDKEKEREREPELAQESSSPGLKWTTSIKLPTKPTAPFTMAQSQTPGWDTPWTEKAATRGVPNGEASSSALGISPPDDRNKHLSPWQMRKKKFRRFILTNVHVPLLFRFINISLTAAALGVALHIRKVELRYRVMGAVGSSPTLVIIFAPLTLVHVMVAIYLEYFGRPLGLWRTTGKLAHTLSETLFICAWSAALSLSFDNFFTSLVPCASTSSISWYSQIPRPAPPDPLDDIVANGVGRQICRDQLALICLVGVGLLMYCTNLIISLYRIFEKIKYHAPVGAHGV